MIKDGQGTLVNNGLAAKAVHFSFTLLPANESMPCNCGQSIHCTATQNGMHFILSLRGPLCTLNKLCTRPNKTFAPLPVRNEVLGKQKKVQHQILYCSPMEYSSIT